MQRRSKRRLASGLVFTLLTGLMVVLSFSTAQATVTAGEVVFSQATGNGNEQSLVLRKSGTGAEAVLTLGSTDQMPDISPDGSRVAFQHTPAGDSTQGISLINTDGSGQTRLTSPDGSSPDANLHFWDEGPRWSPDGTKVTFVRHYSDNIHHVWVINADGSGLTDLTPNDPGSTMNSSPVWSPDGSHIALTQLSSSYQSQIWVMNTNGANPHLVSPSEGCDSYSPDYSPDGTRIYFQRWCSGVADLNYLTSSDDFATSGNSSRTLVAAVAANNMRVSGNGLDVFYDDGVGNIYSVAIGTGAATQLTADPSPKYNVQPTPVRATYPAAPPSNATVTLSAPSSSDTYGQRQITIGLSSTGVQRFEYGWSTSSTTAPNTSYLQTSTDLTTKKGTLNFLGMYSGSGTTWNGGTQPDQDWYLWVRSVQSGGTPNSWGTPLKVHTPKPGVWVAVGDSTSSGHHQDTDEPNCAILPTPEPFTCEPEDLAPNDTAFSWVTGAVTGFNTNQKLPSSWQVQPIMVAVSGRATSDFGVAGATPGSIAWTGGGQSAKMASALYQRYDSWNLVSMTGGANDTNWADVMQSWYIDNFGTGRTPWGLSAGDILHCPNTESVWQSLQANDLDETIEANLQGIVTAAGNASPGTRVLDVGYPYPVNTGTNSTGNPCYADWNNGLGGTNHGAKSVIDALNATHTGVTGARVKYIDVAADFGASPTTSGYVQLTRLYGYPHASSSGQTRVANAAVAVATGSGW